MPLIQPPPVPPKKVTIAVRLDELVLAELRIYGTFLGTRNNSHIISESLTRMGRSSIQVTVDTYGHLIPGGNIDWVDHLDLQTSRGKSATQPQPESSVKSAVSSEVQELTDTTWIVGGPSRTRTCDQRIMSPPL